MRSPWKKDFYLGTHGSFDHVFTQVYFLFASYTINFNDFTSFNNL